MSNATKIREVTQEDRSRWFAEARDRHRQSAKRRGAATLEDCEVGAIVKGDVVRARDTDWLVLNVTWVRFGEEEDEVERHLAVRGLGGLMRGRDAVMVDRFEHGLELVDDPGWNQCACCGGTGMVQGGERS